MVNERHLELQRAAEYISVPGALVGFRYIRPGDETALLPGEMEAFRSSVVAVQRASGAARIVARQLLEQLGHSTVAIPKGLAGAPTWPPGITGSLAHDAEIAVAALAPCTSLLSMGVDIEPAEPLSRDLVPIVTTPAERQWVSEDPFLARVLFCVKEAVYKTVYPLDRVFLDHHDVEVNLNDCVATIRGGRQVPFRYRAASHILVLAVLPASPVENVR